MKRLDSSKYYKLFIESIYMIIGNFLFAFAISCFVAPNNIAPGGASGVAIMVNYLTSVPIGVISILVNIPLLIIAYFILGKAFVFKTLVSLISFSIFTDYVFKDLIKFSYQEDMVLAMLFGGVIGGIGSGILFIKNGSGGGSDVIALLIQSKKPYFKTGRLVMIIDFIIISVSVFVFKNINTAMYAIVYKVVISLVIDKLIYGFDEGKMIIINSVNKTDEIKDYITKTMSKGVTVINSSGGYSNHERRLLLCAVSNAAFVKLRTYIKEVDPSAFIIVTNTSEILGNGFKQI